MNRRRAPLRTRPIPPTGAYQLTACSEETPIPVEYVEFISNPRNGFCSDDKHVIISCDFSNQEARVAAAVSKDPAMVEALTAPTVLTRPDGTTYNNVRADLHSLTTATCTHPHLVAGLTEDLWDAAVRVTEPGQKQKARQYGKTLNFSMLFLSSAKAVSEKNHVPLVTAEAWVKGHMTTYKGYYEWASEYGAIAAARGFAILPFGLQNTRWVAEERSGGKDGDSAERAAVNFCIQSSSAIQTKEAMIRLDNRFEGTETRMIAQIHDEILVLAPGRTYIDYDRCEIKDGVFTKIVFGYDEEAEHWARITKEIMEGVQNEMFDRMQSPIRGMASYADAIAPVWAH